MLLSIQQKNAVKRAAAPFKNDHSTKVRIFIVPQTFYSIFHSRLPTFAPLFFTFNGLRGK
jgi:hypothetical protein